jgi:hypothetical protein
MEPKRVISIVQLAGAYENWDKTSVYVIPDESNADRDEVPMPYDRADAFEIVKLAPSEAAGECAQALERLFTALGYDVQTCGLCDD